MIKNDTFENLVLGMKYFRAEEGNEMKYYKGQSKLGFKVVLGPNWE